MDNWHSFKSKLRFVARISWKKPSAGVIKVNVDGSVKSHNLSATAGGVIRNEKGDWLTGFTYVVGIANVLTAEIWAIYQGLKLCGERGFKKVQLESDSLMAIKKISSTPVPYDVNGQLIRAIQDYFQRNWSCNICHIHRESNKSADWMATKSLVTSTGLHTFENPPNGIFPFLLADFLGVEIPRVMY
ncbi:hypothetical protein REPUB_Repub10bG0121500 [Reevesia pubescens]